MHRTIGRIVNRLIPVAQAAPAAPAKVAAAPAPQPPAVAALDQREKDRIRGILNCAEAAGQQELARGLAFDTDLPVDQARAVLAAAPAPAPAPPTIAERMARSSNAGQDLGHMPRPSGDAAADAGWNEAIAKANAAHGFPVVRPDLSSLAEGVHSASAGPAPGRLRARADATAGHAVAESATAGAVTGADGRIVPRSGPHSEDPLVMAERLPAGRPRETSARSARRATICTPW
jgi:hypothetical protein